MKQLLHLVCVLTSAANLRLGEQLHHAREARYKRGEAIEGNELYRYDLRSMSKSLEISLLCDSMLTI